MQTILLVEDNQTVRENTAEILELAGYRVITAENGKQGAELAQRQPPDLIVCDIMMPELDGYGVLHILSKNNTTAHIPFIFLTAKAERSDLRKGMEMGADDYLTKPFEEAELLKAVESRLKKSEILKNEYQRTIKGINEFVDEARGLEALKKISPERKIKKIKKRETIFSEESIPVGLYFLNKGKVKTYRMNEEGKEYVTGLYNEGDFFGYVSLLEGNKHADSAMTLEEAEICIIPQEDFFALLYKNRDVAAKFIKMLAGNLAEKENQLLKLAYNSVRKRVAEGLIQLRNKYNGTTQGNFAMAIPREDLANMVGTSTESVIRTLSDFKDEGLLQINGSNITLLHPEKLERMRN